MVTKTTDNTTVDAIAILLRSPNMDNYPSILIERENNTADNSLFQLPIIGVTSSDEDPYQCAKEWIQQKIGIPEDQVRICTRLVSNSIDTYNSVITVLMEITRETRQLVPLNTAYDWINESELTQESLSELLQESWSRLQCHPTSYSALYPGTKIFQPPTLNTRTLFYGDHMLWITDGPQMGPVLA